MISFEQLLVGRVLAERYRADELLERVGVLGCGLMGSGIAQVCAQAGYETIVREVSDELCQKGVGGRGTSQLRCSSGARHGGGHAEAQRRRRGQPREKKGLTRRHGAT